MLRVFSSCKFSPPIFSLNRSAEKERADEELEDGASEQKSSVDDEGDADAALPNTPDDDDDDKPAR